MLEQEPTPTTPPRSFEGHGYMFDPDAHPFEKTGTPVHSDLGAEEVHPESLDNGHANQTAKHPERYDERRELSRAARRRVLGQ